MARVKRAVQGKKHRREVLKAAKEQVWHSLDYAYRDWRAKKGEFRRLWIARINAAARENGMSYSRFVAGLAASGVEVDRKVLADIAVTDPSAFRSLVETARAGLERDTGSEAVSA